MQTINNRQDIIDSRDIIERLDELRLELVDAHESECNADEPDHFDDWLASVVANDDSELQHEAQEFIQLQSFAAQFEGYGDFEHGDSIIRESYFKEYAEELAADLGLINREAAWPNNCIDWNFAAEQLKVDYAEADFDGVKYLMRA